MRQLRPAAISTDPSRDLVHFNVVVKGNLLFIILVIVVVVIFSLPKYIDHFGGRRLRPGAHPFRFYMLSLADEGILGIIGQVEAAEDIGGDFGVFIEPMNDFDL